MNKKLFTLILVVIGCIKAWAGFPVPPASSADDALNQNSPVWATVSGAATNGGAFLVTSTSRVRYNTFNEAYTNASAGQTVELTSGLHDLGNVTYSLDRSVNIVGAGMFATTMKADGFRWYPTATNCSLKGVTVTQDATDAQNLLIFACKSTNTLNVALDDVRLYTRQTNSLYHGFEASGDGITLNNVRSDILAGHAFVLKGVANAVVNNCRSKGGSFDGMLIKGGNIGVSDNGPCDHIVINNFLSEGGPSQSIGIQVQAYNDSYVSNIWINSFSHIYTNAVSVGAACLVENTGGSIGNVHFDNVNIADCTYGYKIGNGNALTNTDISVSCYIKNSTTHSALNTILLIGGNNGRIVADGLYGSFSSGKTPIGFSVAGDGTLLEADISNVHLRRGDGSFVDIDHTAYRSELDATRPLLTKIVATTFADCPTGMAASYYRSSANAATATIVVNETTGRLAVSKLAVGDPIQIVGGTTPGVYKLLDFGTSTAPNDPIAGAQTGDTWIEIESGGATVADGEFYCGKIAFQIADSTDALKWYLVDAKVTAINWRSADSSPSSSLDSVGAYWGWEWSGWRTDNPANGFTLKNSKTDNLTYGSTIYAHTFEYGGYLYAAIFAKGGSNSTFWGYMQSGYFELQVTTDGESTLAIKPVSVLP